MSSSKTSPPMEPPPASDVPPPSYAESLSSPQPSQAPSQTASRVAGLVEALLPHIHGDPTISLVIIPLNVSTLVPADTDSASKKDGQPLSFPGETVVGMQSTDNPVVIRLSAVHGPLDFWRRPTVIGELTTQVGQKMSGMGYTVVSGSPRVRGRGPPGSKDVEWKSPERAILKEGEAKVSTEIKEVCLRVENEMGLYETKSGNALVTRIDIGADGDGAD